MPRSSTGTFLKGFHETAKSYGAKKKNSDFSLVIAGSEGLFLLCKQFPWPVLAPSESIEVPSILGSAVWEHAQVKTNHQGQIMFMETVAGHVDALLQKIAQQGGNFHAKVYEGTPDNYLCYKPIYGCSMNIENPDRDWENRTQILLYSGTIFFHYYGETVQGPSTDYR